MLAALAVTRYVLPPLLRGRPAPRRLAGARRRRGDRALDWLRAHRRTAAAFVGAGRRVACAARPADAALARFARRHQRRRPGAEGRDRARARAGVARRRRAAGDRQRARRGGGAARERPGRRPPRARAAEPAWSARVVSLHAFLWSADLQKRSRGGVAAVPDLAGRTLAALDARRVQARGVRAVSPRRPPRCTRRRPCRRCASPICMRRRSTTVVRPFVVKLGDEIGVLTFVRDLKDPGGAGRLPRGSARRALLRSGALPRRDLRDASGSRRCRRSASASALIV